MSATTLARSSRLIPAAAGIVAAALLTVSPSPASAIDAVFDVTDYGATPNDATDDAPAFRSAIAAADAVAGSTVYVPAGTYLMDRPSDSVIGIVRMQNVTDVDVVGDGVTSVVKFKARNWSTGGDPHLFWCSGCSLVNFSDFTIDGSKSDAGFAGQEQMHGIFWLNSHDVTVQRMRFDDNFGDGVMTIGDGGTTQDVLVADNEFLNGGRSGIGVQGGTTQMQFLGNYFEGTRDQDIDFEPTGSSEVPPRPGPTDILIQDNTMVRGIGTCVTKPAGQECTQSVTIGGQEPTNKAKRIQLVDNQITGGGVRVFQTEDVTIEGNTVSSDLEQISPVLNVVGSTTGLVVRDNVLESDNPGKPVVEVGAANAAKPVDVLFEANTIRQLADGDGIRILQAIGPVTVRDNPEISGTGTGTGIKYNLEASDGITRGAVDVSGNTIEGFPLGALFHAVGTSKFDTVTFCDNDVSGGTAGVRFELINPASLAEAIVCNNVYGAGVTTKVFSDQVTSFTGTGSPEGVVRAPATSEFVRTDESNRLYIKQTPGSVSTGWLGT